MSKKINLVTPGVSRSSLWSLFTKYVSRKVNEEEEYWKSVGRRLGGKYGYLYDYDDEYSDEMEKLRAYYDGIESDYPEDDFYVDDDGCIIFPLRKDKEKWDGFKEDDSFKKSSSNGKKKKHSKHRSRHKGNNKPIDITKPYSGFEGDSDEDGVSCNKIYFYVDYTDKYDRLEFDSLVEFDEYCQEEGYVVPPYVGERIAYRPVSHCCLSPYAKSRGILEIMAEESYGDLLYEACDVLV